jgi:hypothetical protein
LEKMGSGNRKGLKVWQTGFPHWRSFEREAPGQAEGTLNAQNNEAFLESISSTPITHPKDCPRELCAVPLGKKSQVKI